MRPTGLHAVAESETRRGAGGRIRRPAGDTFVDIAYARPAPSNPIPLVVLPGGPGLGSLVPYRGFRRRAAARGFDVVMMEHRGVGLSRLDVDGADLPRASVTIAAVVDDLAAVLDHAGIERAVIYGCSYGTSLAQVFGARHPQRVAGMVLDSTVLDVEGDLALTRAHRRALLLTGSGRLPGLIRALIEDGTVPVDEIGHVAQVVYEFSGPAVLARLLRARAQGRGVRVWRRLVELGGEETSGSGRRFVIEPDLVEGIAHGELGASHAPDGLPLDPQAAFVRDRAPAFHGEPEDLPARLPGFTWPTAVVSGERDLRTPRPVAERTVALLPDGVLVPLADTGHSALDTHRLAALIAARAVAQGDHARLPDLAGAIADLPREGASRLLGPAIRAGLAADLALPGGAVKRA
ncbi:prolyl aminopeptidase [Tsukamurella pulmonis]|uniref:Alpha/beta hydrolase fold n=1 Tax=Tsukamurella pulmonis TaxID=47312 RepID=A0A1H1DX97_9ACTN|nr:alpha/beta fold hydrolase [Tsukamurella pulmonis]KXO92185.1 prolyl aminopeptidase [Tsukamurella pulmonis]SDQ80526.1 alpha/beta hydrolase fold [Tsukamurella pulmonis]SUP21628.1 Proline iminopeptidase [Tsukamurella pulmonis]